MGGEGSRKTVGGGREMGGWKVAGEDANGWRVWEHHCWEESFVAFAEKVNYKTIVHLQGDLAW